MVNSMIREPSANPAIGSRLSMLPEEPEVSKAREDEVAGTARKIEKPYSGDTPGTSTSVRDSGPNTRELLDEFLPSVGNYASIH